MGATIWIWPLIFNAIAFLFVYVMCPDVSSHSLPIKTGVRTDCSQPTNKTLEEVDALFAKDEAILNRLNHVGDEKPTVQEIEEST